MPSGISPRKRASAGYGIGARFLTVPPVVASCGLTAIGSGTSTIVVPDRPLVSACVTAVRSGATTGVGLSAKARNQAIQAGTMMATAPTMAARAVPARVLSRPPVAAPSAPPGVLVSEVHTPSAMDTPAATARLPSRSRPSPRIWPRKNVRAPRKATAALNSKLGARPAAAIHSVAILAVPPLVLTSSLNADSPMRTVPNAPTTNTPIASQSTGVSDLLSRFIVSFLVGGRIAFEAQSGPVLLFPLLQSDEQFALLGT